MENKSSRQWLILLVVGLGGLLLGILCGALGGGAIGYMLGRRTSGGLGGGWQGCPEGMPCSPERQPSLEQPLPLRPATPRPGVLGGAVVAQVLAGTPAERAGLQVGDTIVAVDNEPVQSAAHLSTLIARKTPGDRVVLAVVRGSTELRIDVQLAQSPQNPTQGYLGVEVRDSPQR